MCARVCENDQGTNGRWKDVLTVAQSERYEKKSREQLGDELFQWSANGGVVGGK